MYARRLTKRLTKHDCARVLAAGGPSVEALQEQLAVASKGLTNSD